MQEKFVELGRVTVNYEPVGLEYVMKGNDLMANTIHRYHFHYAFWCFAVHEIAKNLNHDLFPSAGMKSLLQQHL